MRITRPLKLDYMNLCGSIKIQNIGGKKYIFVIVDDFSRFTYTRFLKSKDEAADVLITFVKIIRTKLKRKIVGTRLDHKIESINFRVKGFCAEEGS